MMKSPPPPENIRQESYFKAAPLREPIYINLWIKFHTDTTNNSRIKISKITGWAGCLD